MSVVLRRPYEFVPPVRTNLWPSLIQTLRLPDWYLRRSEGLVAYEIRHLSRWTASLDAGDRTLLTPNHCRLSDPIVMGWAARAARQHLHAMASWHLFNLGVLETFALRRMGAFSINREGNDRQSLDTAIEILATGRRSLVIFPEGTTNRTNDVLKPLLDGVAFIARSAAKRLAKSKEASAATADRPGRVVVHPVALKYLCVDPVEAWAERQLTQLERRLGWRSSPPADLVRRTTRLTHGMLSLKEIEFTGRPGQGDLIDRRDRLMAEVLRMAESSLGMTGNPDDSVRTRVRDIRSEVVSQYFALPAATRAGRRQAMESIAAQADFAQTLLSFPETYLTPGQVTDTRLVETIQRIEESIDGHAPATMRLKVIIEFGEAIPVDTARPDRMQADPLMRAIETDLTTRLARLSDEARLIA